MDKATKQNYFIWLFNQLKGWPMQNYMLFFFAFGFQLALLIGSPINSVTLITFIGTLLGTLCVLAINATKAINGWLGLISSPQYTKQMTTMNMEKAKFG